MLKRGLGIFLAAVGLFWGITTYAAEVQPIITEAHFYTGTLYYCDAESGVVVLKNVDILGNVNQSNTKTAAEAEYAEIPIVGPAIFKDKTEIALSDCNYYPDSEVRVLITRNSAGALRVLQLKFL